MSPVQTLDFQGGIISEGIFNLVPSSKNPRKNHCLSTFQPKVPIDLVVFLRIGPRLKIPFEITPPIDNIINHDLVNFFEDLTKLKISLI